MATTKRRAPAADFYNESLTEAEKEALEVAREMEGLAEEAAVLRVKLRTLLGRGDVDVRLLRYGIDALVKVVATQYRLSPKSKRELTESMAATLESLGELLVPPGQ